MSDTSDLTPPGSAVYDSQTMYVGDGTWDSKANTFLLPNLQGLNFDTMRYNGKSQNRCKVWTNNGRHGKPIQQRGGL